VFEVIPDNRISDVGPCVIWQDLLKVKIAN